MKFQGVMSSVKFKAGAVHAPRFSLSGVREFFRYHGVLAPGVRLLRVLPFGMKAGVVSAAFLLPLALTCGQYVQLSNEQGQQIEQAREALKLSGELNGLLTELEDLRRVRFYALHQLKAPPEARGISPETQLAALKARMTTLNAQDLVGRGVLSDSTKKDLHETVECVDALARPHREAEPLLTWETECIQKTIDLLQHVVQQSPLSSLGDPALLQLQSLVLIDLPQVREYLITLRGPANAVLQGREVERFTRLMFSRAMALQQVIERAQERLEGYGEGRFDLSGFKNLPLWASLDTMLHNAALTEHELERPVDASGIPATATKVAQEVHQVRDQGLKLLSEQLDSAEDRLWHQRWVMGASVAALVALAVYLLLAFYRVMQGGLRMLSTQVARMASGDLSARPQPWGNDEVAQALSSLGASLAKLGDLFAAVRQGVAAVSHASREIASGNHDLTRRTDRSGQAIDQILQGVTGYTAQLDECGQQVDRAVEVVEAMRLDAARSRSRMGRLDERMQSLQGKSREIGEIVELIDNIAFRTNILALNASVEAAKAGEAGRGFAVVAQEVRGLAQRSAESARRISDIIGRSTQDIEQGSELTRLASEALRDTDGHVLRIHETMQEIVSLTRVGQQSSQQILDEIRGLSEVTQENTRLVGQMEAASHALSTQGDHLSDKVATFKLS